MDNSVTLLTGRRQSSKTCIHFLKGRCTYGDQCSFSHNVTSPSGSLLGNQALKNGHTDGILFPDDDKGLDIEAVEPLAKSVPLCKYYAAGKCHAGEQCNFRHDPSAPSKRKWRTIPCKNYLAGSCLFGDRCSFIHSEPSPPSRSLNQPVPRQHSSHLPPFLFSSVAGPSSSTPIPTAARVLPPPSSDPAHSGEEWRVKDPYLIPNPSPQPANQPDWSHPHTNPRSNTLTPNPPGSHSPLPPAYPSLSPLLPAPVFPTLHDTVEREPDFPVLDYNDMNSHGLGFVLSPEEPDSALLPKFSFANGLSSPPFAAHQNGATIPRMYKTKMCKFYAQGSCPRGDECTFIHEHPQATAGPSHPLYRTKECKYHLAGHCHQGDECTFKHTGPAGQGAAFLPFSPRLNGDSETSDGTGHKPVFSSRPCKWYLQGSCYSGDKCLYSHDIGGSSSSPSILCRFYNGLPGSCRNGASCPYLHSDLAHDQKSSDQAESGPGDESEEDGDLVVFKMS